MKSWFLDLGRFPDKGKKNKYAHFSQVGQEEIASSTNWTKPLASQQTKLNRTKQVGQGDVAKSDDDSEHSGL